MDRSQTEMLRINHRRLVEGIDQISSILDYLYTENIFSQNVQQKILRERDPLEQNRMLLNHLKKRPPSDYDKFARILCLTDNEHMADLLVPGISSSTRPVVPVHVSRSGDSDLHSVDLNSSSTAEVTACEASEQDGSTSILDMGEDFIDDDPKPEYSLPKVWPDEEILEKPVNVRPVTSKDMKSKWNQNKRQKQQSSPSDSIYTMCGRGRAIIISNELFHNRYYNRYGNKFDQDRMETLLEGLNFDVEVWPNKTKDELFGGTGLLTNESRTGRDDYQCFLMVILSHGQRDTIMTADNQYVPVAEIVDYFDVSRSHRFAGKPKIFLVQACQGDEKDNGELPHRVAEVTERFNGLNLEQTDAGTLERNVEKIPCLSDIIIVTATVPGFVSWRNIKYGTWFIQAVIEIFTNLACDEELITMLTKVSNLVSRGRSQVGQHVQISNTTHNTLNKSVFFFPGLKP